jgi:Tol biopolymer transport system component
MRLRLCLAALLMLTVFVVAGINAQSDSRSPEALLRAAMDAETVDGDVSKAQEMYRALTAMTTASPRVKAQALLRLGDAATRLGQPDAPDYYRQITLKFADQADVVRVARNRLESTSPVKRSETLVCDGEGCHGTPSPNGRLIVFHDVRGGNVLRLRDLEAGTIRTFAQAPLANRGIWAFWTEDSRKFAYRFERDSGCRPAVNGRCVHALHVVSVRDGRQTTLSMPNDYGILLGWSRDARRLLVGSYANDDTTLAWLPADGGAAQTIGTVRGSLNGGAISPDGRFLAFTFTDLSDGNDGLDVVELTSLRRTVLSPTAAGYAEPVGWTPDGRFFVFGKGRRPRSLWAVRVTNGQPQGAAMLVDRRNSESGSDHMMRDGTVWMQNPRGVELYTATLDPVTGRATGQPVPLGNSASNGGYRVRISPDVRQIVYGVDITAASRTFNVFRLGVNDVRTVQPSHVIAGPGVACWSGDGSSILFNGRPSPDRPVVLVRLNMQTGEEAALPGEVSYWVESCASGIGVSASNRAILVRNLADGTEREAFRPATGTARLSNPVISRDGSQIAFFEQIGNELELRVVPAAGGDARALTRVPRIANPALNQQNQIAWAPDGRYVYFCRVDQDGMVETFRVPVGGGTPTSIGYRGPGAADIEISSDGRHIVSRWGHQNPGRGQRVALSGFVPAGR